MAINPNVQQQDLQCVDVTRFDRANTFLDALGSRSDLWTGGITNWVFRGQALARWKLLASAQRNHLEAFSKFGIALPPLAIERTPLQEKNELQMRLLFRFRERLERSGLCVPTPPPRIGTNDEFEVFWVGQQMFREALPLMSLAQHYGLPTFLLHWTRRPLVAAYFAAIDENADLCSSADDWLALWAVSPHRVKLPPGVKLFYEAPGGTNPNLQAQQGLFSLLVDEDGSSLEEYVSKHPSKPGDCPIRKLLLPRSCVPRLLRILADEGITGASMFPGNDGVVRAMREEGRWGNAQTTE